MENKDFTTTIIVDKTPEIAFNAINNIQGWWSENIEGRTDKLNSIFTYRDRYLNCKMQITELTHKKIVWNIVDSHNEFFKDKTEWNGTKIVFEIADRNKKTEVKFTHAGLSPNRECYSICSNSWDFFITTSLKSLIETGKGKDISKDENSFTTRISVDKSPNEVFNAINNVRDWWSKNIEGKTDELNAKFFYHHKDVHLTKLEIVELIPNEKVTWFVKDNYFNFIDDKTEWKGTKIIFEISKKDNKTQVDFTHHGLIPENECYEVCENAWSKFIKNSLYDLITTGKGQPTPKETEGFDIEMVEKWKLE